jgi:hypothetical protein
MVMLARRIGLLALVLALVPAPAALAQQKLAPPGNSAVDEYLETVPAAGGNQPSTGGGTPRTLNKDSREALAALGPDGKAALAAAEATAPAAPSGRADGAGGSAAPPEPAGGESVPGAIARAVGGSGDAGGMGVWLPLLLTVSAAGAIALGVARRRSA